MKKNAYICSAKQSDFESHNDILRDLSVFQLHFCTRSRGCLATKRGRALFFIHIS